MPAATTAALMLLMVGKTEEWMLELYWAKSQRSMALLPFLKMTQGEGNVVSAHPLSYKSNSGNLIQYLTARVSGK